jgi:hypothetical protein
LLVGLSPKWEYRLIDSEIDDNLRQIIEQNLIPNFVNKIGKDFNRQNYIRRFWNLLMAEVI